jgi:peptide-methionine (S)-S-oxide reductase
VSVGYTGGQTKNPTYEEVSAGRTGHLEAVQVTYDPATISYQNLVDAFWHSIDPVTPDGQFCDLGSQYRTAIFYHDSAQRRVAEESKRQLETPARFGQPIVTAIQPAGEFYRAEEYHQHYYRKNPVRYNLYRVGCGRDRRLAELWGSAALAAPTQR